MFVKAILEFGAIRKGTSNVPTLGDKELLKGNANTMINRISNSLKEDFIQKTLRLAGDISLQEKLKKSAPEIVQKKYDWKLYENRLLELVELFERKTS